MIKVLKINCECLYACLMYVLISATDADALTYKCAWSEWTFRQVRLNLLVINYTLQYIKTRALSSVCSPSYNYDYNIHNIKTNFLVTLVYWICP